MLVLTDTDPAISSEDFLQFEEILGKKLPKSMMDFYLKYNGGQPQVRGVHDDHLLFPFKIVIPPFFNFDPFILYNFLTINRSFSLIQLLHFLQKIAIKY